MAEESATFSIELKDGTSGAADAAANALTNLRGKIEEGKKSLRQMEAAMKSLTSGTVSNVAAVRQLQEKMAAQKNTIAETTAKYVQLGGTFDALPKKMARTKGGFDSLLGSAEKVPGPIGEISGKLQRLGAGGPVAILLGIAAGMALLVAAAAAAAAALVGYALAQADARRSELLRLEGLATMRGALGAAGARAREAQEAIDRVSSSVALGRADVAGYAEQLHRAGLRGDQLAAALEGAAITASVQGAEQARHFTRQAIGYARAGRSVDALAERVRGRLGGIARRQLLGLGAQATKLRENFDKLFDTLQVEGFLEALSSITELLSQNTETGRALRAIVETLIQPLIDQAIAAAPFMRRFFQGMVIGALLVTIAILQLRNWLTRTFGDSELLANIDGLKIALIAGLVVFGLLVLAVLAAAAVVAVFAAAVVSTGVALAAPVIAIAALIYGIVRLVQYLGSIDWGGIASGMIDGLVNGIRGGTSRVVQAVRGLAGEAQRALVSALQIGSPSRVFADLGLEIPRGLAQGIDRGATIPAESVGELAGGAASRQLGGSNETAVSVGDVHVHVENGEPGEIAGGIGAALERVFEGLAIRIGAPST